MTLPDQAREARGWMRETALQWRRTPPRAFRQRSKLVGRAVYYREVARICLEQAAAPKPRP